MSAFRDPILEIGEQAFVGEIERPRVFPVVVRNSLQAIDDLIVVHFDRELAALVEAAGGEIDRSHDGRDAVSFLVRIKECIENPERIMFEL